MVCVRPLDSAGSRARHHRWQRVAIAVITAVSVAGALGVASPAASAATTNRVAVVVEVDGVVHTAKVSFSTPSISGLDALRAAGFDPLVRVFGGNGGAVCALDVGTTTIGCPADSTCLTCDEPRYWAYFRALAGETQYTYSRAGSGTTQVHDGDVEAWAWGTGSAPTHFVSFTDVWGTGPPPTTPPPTTTPPTTKPPASHPPVTGSLTPTSAPSATVSPSDRSAPTTAPSGPLSSTTVAKSGATSTTENPPAGDPGTSDGAKKVATAPVVARGGRNGGSPVGLIAFGAILAAMVGTIVFVRRRGGLSAT